MRLLLLLLVIGAAAYFTVPTRETHEAAVRAFMQAQTQEQTGAVQAQTGISLISRDPANNRITFQISHLTEFALGSVNRMYLSALYR